LAEGISQLVSRKLEILKFHNNLLEVFMVNPKKFLGMAMPNQCCQTVA